jgi:RNA polymerase sigma-70 factor (ECF subfamily)
MLAEERDALEGALREARARGDLRAVATCIVERYGGEILGFLSAALGDREEAGEVFAQFCEDMWSGLPAFRSHSSFRTWAYTIARNAAHRHRRDPLRRRGVALSDCPELGEIEQRVRTTTLSYLRSEVKDRVSRLRDALDPEDRMLLILRVDRGMAWNDMVSVLDAERSDGAGAGDAGGAESAMSDAERAKRAASLRKRFERLKERLRALADADARTLG